MDNGLCLQSEVSPLVTQLSWTNHLLIMSGSKSDSKVEKPGKMRLVCYLSIADQSRHSSKASTTICAIFVMVSC